MRPVLHALALLLASASPLAGAAAEPASHPAIDSLADAVRRGEVAPLQRALTDQAIRPEIRAVLRAALALSRGDPNAARDPALRRLANPASDPALRQAALFVLTDAALANGDYGAAARDGRLFAEALAAAGRADEASGVDRTWRLAALLVGRPAFRVDGAVRAGTVAARIDRVGLPRVDVTINGQAQEAVFDTGAGFSVLSADTARRLGVTVLTADTSIGNGVQGTVPARIGIADRFEIAGTTLRNVVFLIIDDAQLTFPVPGGYDIKAILGLPVMRALGRVRMEAAAGRLTVLPYVAALAGPANLHASGNSLFVDTEIGGRPVPLLLDTGANDTSLSALYAAANGEAVAALSTAETRSASAGGAQTRHVATWTDAPVSIGGRTLRLPRLNITLPAEGAPPARNYGTVGASILRAFESYTIDFERMRFDVGPPVQAASR